MKNNTKKFQIVKAAQKRFIRHGLAKTSVEEIARDLRIAKATIYHYFSSKEEIFYVVITSEIEKYTAEINGIFENPDLDVPAKISAFTEIKLKLKEKYTLLYDVFTNLINDNFFEKEVELFKLLTEQEISIASAFFKKSINKKIEPSAAEFLVMHTWGLAVSSKFTETLNKGDFKKNKDFFIKIFEKGILPQV